MVKASRIPFSIWDWVYRHLLCTEHLDCLWCFIVKAGIEFSSKYN